MTPVYVLDTRKSLPKVFFIAIRQHEIGFKRGCCTYFWRVRRETLAGTESRKTQKPHTAKGCSGILCTPVEFSFIGSRIINWYRTYPTLIPSGILQSYGACVVASPRSLCSGSYARSALSVDCRRSNGRQLFDSKPSSTAVELGKTTPYSMNSLFSEFAGNLEGYFRGCLRLFRAMFGRCFGRFLEGFRR